MRGAGIKMEDYDITKISIKKYLEGIGIPTRREGSRYFASSPFSNDSSWSFCIYPTNTYFDWSTGHGGNIINLVARLYNISLSEAGRILHEGIKHEKYQPNYKQYKQESLSWESFELEKYISTSQEEITQIEAYAKSRGITSGYFPGVFFTREGKHWKRNPSIGFAHIDKTKKVCGAKFRKIVKENPRFSARGRLCMYIPSGIEHAHASDVLYVVEGEGNANSLQNYLDGLGMRCVTTSTGGVADAPLLEDLKAVFPSTADIRVIIDYDGNEKLYQERLKLYKDFPCRFIKMILPKSEDINSLYCKQEMWKIEHLLL